MSHPHRNLILLAALILIGGAPAHAQSSTVPEGWAPVSCVSDADCNDANACTADACIAGQCEPSPLEGACDDGDSCTSGDRCRAGSCEGAALEQCPAPVEAPRAGTALADAPRTLAELPRVLSNYTVIERDVMTPGEPYVVQGTLTIEDGASLTIQPGTVVRFDPAARLLVNGELRARSQAQDIVLQSSAETPLPGSWQGIEIGATATPVMIEGAVIEDAITPILIAGGGMLTQRYSIQHCILRSFTANAIQSGRVTSPTTNVAGSAKTGTIAANWIERAPGSEAPRTGAGIYFVGRPDPAFGLNPTISGNTIRGFDQGVELVAASPRITGNTLEQNNIGLEVRDGSPRITDGNRIVGNGIGISRKGLDNAQLVVNGNAIFGNTGLNYESFSAPTAQDPFRAALFQNAEGNFWGTTDPLEIAAKVSLGRGTTSRPVDFVPFLDAEGGQPVPEVGLLIGVLRPATGNVVAIPPASHVLLLGHTLVPAGVTLEIGAGSRVDAVAGQGLGVDGTLHVLGQTAAPVTFAPLSGTWFGLDIRPGSTGSQIEGAVLQGVRRTMTTVIREGVIDVRGAALALRSTRILDYTGAAVLYRDGATGGLEGVAIDNSVRRNGTGVQVENASPAILDSDIRATAMGVGLYGRTTSVLAGNTLTANGIGVYLEGAQTRTVDPAPQISGNNLFGNALRPNQPVQNLVLDKFGSAAASVAARGNYFGLMSEAEVRATIVNRGTTPVAVDISGFVASPIP